MPFSSLFNNFSEVFIPNILSSFSSHRFLTFIKYQLWVVQLVSLVSLTSIHEANINVFSFAYADLCVCQEEEYSYSLYKSFVVKLMLHSIGSSIRKEHSRGNGAAQWLFRIGKISFCLSWDFQRAFGRKPKEKGWNERKLPSQIKISLRLSKTLRGCADKYYLFLPGTC